MKKNKVKKEFLDQLRKTPIVQVACEKSGISRNSVYRWRKEDKEFEKEMDTALAEGEALVNDISESQLLTLIKEKNWSAISFWLKHRNPRFREKIEITAPKDMDALTPEQEEIVRRALGLVKTQLDQINNNNINQQNYDQQQNTTSGTDGSDDQRQEGENSNH